MADFNFDQQDLKTSGMDGKIINRLTALREDYFRAYPEICVERPRLLTQYFTRHKLFGRDRISVLEAARAYKFMLVSRAPVVWHDHGYRKGMKQFPLAGSKQLFAGSTTSKFKGVPLYPEFMALTIWPELWTISGRKANPYMINENEVNELNHEIFPLWMNYTILELARARGRERTGKTPEIGTLERLVFFTTTKPNCVSHTMPDFKPAITQGLRAMIEQAEKNRQATTDPARREFYEALGVVLSGIIIYSSNLAEQARRMAAAEPDRDLKQELEAIAEVHERVPEYPARTFREGLTTIWMIWTALHLENANAALSLGRLDQVLATLYADDIKAGTLTPDKAVELVSCLWLKIGDHVPTVPEAGENLYGGTGSNQAVTIGGIKEDGTDAVNGLTYVILRATQLMRLRDPNLNARYHPEANSEEYLKALCQVNITTGATPALHNDRAVIKMLESRRHLHGCDEKPWDYGVVGCVEPQSAGRTYGHSGAILMNLTAALELTLFNGCHRHTGATNLISLRTGDPASFQTFDEFKAAFWKQTMWLIKQSTDLNNEFGRVHQDFHPVPILSAFFEGPMEKGMDLSMGGAIINASGATMIGLADVSDGLTAIEQEVYATKKTSMAQMIAALDNNFKDYNDLHIRLRYNTPKFGRDDADASGVSGDRNARWLVTELDRAFSAIANYRGGYYRVGYWTMTSHAGLGRLTGARPNGRKAGKNFSSGITPVSDSAPLLTAALLSVAGLPAEHVSSGMALNLKFLIEPDREAMLKNLICYVKTYFGVRPKECPPVKNGLPAEGGMEIQFNIKDFGEYGKKEIDPQLLVRVSGYTAYFKDLNEQMKKEIIERTQYQLSTGHKIP